MNLNLSIKGPDFFERKEKPVKVLLAILCLLFVEKCLFTSGFLFQPLHFLRWKLTANETYATCFSQL